MATEHSTRKPCSIAGCGKPSRGRGYCTTHWKRWRTHGDPLVVLSKGHRTSIKAGDKFDRWTVVERVFVQRKPKAAFWRCVCECGTERVHESWSLQRWHTKSCGCLRTEQKTIHGLCRTPEYMAWQGMLDRCRNRRNDQFKDYGGRGISVCERWRQSFEAFLCDIGKRPSKAHSVDRIDVDGNYEPSNCRWATKTVQQNNRRDNHYIEWNGIKRTATEWARSIGTDPGTIKYRIAAGWPLDLALTRPPNNKKVTKRPA